MSIFNVRTLAWVPNLLRNALYDNYSQHTSSILLTFSQRCRLFLPIIFNKEKFINKVQAAAQPDRSHVQMQTALFHMLAATSTA